MANVIQDISVRRVPLPDRLHQPNLHALQPKIHGGFWHAYENIGDGVTRTTMQLVDEINAQGHWADILVTGHSLGGAMASLCTLELARFSERRQMSLSLYTFGAPRAGNSGFADLVNTVAPTYYRVVHKKDPVPRVPKFWFKFKHAGTEVWLSSKYVLIEPLFIERKLRPSGNRPKAHRLSTYFDLLRQHLVDNGLVTILGPLAHEGLQPPGEEELHQPGGEELQPSHSLQIQSEEIAQ
eukprot:CAMPEP_0175831214 /NCGR_PEP_ID=MMETSP0107_2-20121207/14342_1 /TAXON_ID=195067 ORGANISM="Goniomonas pacifica, Strain CCMP1869" /NCGR_SAMPLE_ID=MMETSP0107_2 /ASSEMBLY_ACC=CAM_ASM_000203 /LENGTH=238 /DNA_ID=CAMNT_0017144231 /DNA_START=10 /DNA_END=726 /DNA_ORIENTATION=+